MGGLHDRVVSVRITLQEGQGAAGESLTQDIPTGNGDLTAPEVVCLTFMPARVIIVSPSVLEGLLVKRARYYHCGSRVSLRRSAPVLVVARARPAEAQRRPLARVSCKNSHRRGLTASDRRGKRMNSREGGCYASGQELPHEDS